MDRWGGAVCVITGAAGGIGSELVKILLNHNVVVVGLDITRDKLQELKERLLNCNINNFHAVQCDLRIETSIVETFYLIAKQIGPISILINAAGVADNFLLLDANERLTDRIFETNVTATIVCSREAVNCMSANDIQGHIINVCSILGHTLPEWSYEGVVYAASKQAVRVISEGLRRELLLKNSSIKVTNLSPGLVKTPMTDKIKSYTKIEPINVAEACVVALSTAPNVLISQLTVVPTRERHFDLPPSGV